MIDRPPQGLLDYYNAELAYLHTVGREFADAHPGVASRLRLGAHESPDPHVERLIESFAFLTARVQRTLDLEVPGISSALLEVLYPNYLDPVPPMTVAEFDVDPSQGRLSSGYLIPSGTSLFTKMDAGEVCRFRTTYPVSLQPLRVVHAVAEPAAQYGFLGDVRSAVQVVRVRLEGVGVPIEEVRPSSLRFYLAGDTTAAQLYELLFGHLLKVVLMPEDEGPAPACLPATSVRPVGLEPEEGVLPCPRAAHPAFRLLQEYFTIPRKLMFFDLEGVEKHGAKKHLDLLFVLDSQVPHRMALDARSFRLGCTPVVNLFERLSEPLRVDQHQVEYRLVADARRERHTEVHSILDLSSAPDGYGGADCFEPFYSYTHQMDAKQRTFWRARRVPSERGHVRGSELMLSFLDLRGRPAPPPTPTVWARVLCTNRHHAETLEAGTPLQMERAAPVRGVHVVHVPTPAVQPPLDAQTQWRLVSQLSLSHLSLAGTCSQQSLRALREILRLYATWGDPTVEAQVAGIVDMSTEPIVRRAGPAPWAGFCRGTRIELTLDPAGYQRRTPLLLGMVLDRFFALYASVNSFTQLSVRLQGSEVPWKTWDARVGGRPLL
jgi:type VI secretion system protein ImpG